jgi:mycothiol S-conjugate amidase
VAERLCLLTVHAHPDDEASKGAGTVARYHAEGVHTVLVCCTGGEEGDILNPAMDRPEVRERLAEIRRQELEASAKIIGYDEVALLGYRDSGMPGSDANARADAFANAPLDEAVSRLVGIIRRVRPQVMVTYPEEQREYPHPDHLRVHEISVAAFDAAGDPERYPDAGPAWAPSKLYYTLWPRRRMREIHEKFLELGLESPLDEDRLERIRRDEPVTTSIDLTGFVEVRSDALRAHATQVDPASPYWFGLPPEVLQTIYPFDDYYLARSRPGPAPAAVDPGPAPAAVDPGPAPAAVDPGPVPAAVDPGPAPAAVDPGPGKKEDDLFSGLR